MPTLSAKRCRWRTYAFNARIARRGGNCGAASVASDISGVTRLKTLRDTSPAIETIGIARHRRRLDGVDRKIPTRKYIFIFATKSGAFSTRIRSDSRPVFAPLRPCAGADPPLSPCPPYDRLHGLARHSIRIRRAPLQRLSAQGLFCPPSRRDTTLPLSQQSCAAPPAKNALPYDQLS